MVSETVPFAKQKHCFATQKHFFLEHPASSLAVAPKKRHSPANYLIIFATFARSTWDWQTELWQKLIVTMLFSSLRSRRGGIAYHTPHQSFSASQSIAVVPTISFSQTPCPHAGSGTICVCGFRYSKNSTVIITLRGVRALCSSKTDPTR